VYHLLSLLESDAAGVVASQSHCAELPNCRPCTKSWRPPPPRQGNITDQFFAINERFHMRLLAIADNRWRDQMVADLRKVMKLNRHNSLLKTGRIDESLAEHPQFPPDKPYGT
jgi:DNA-binding GntR family transcriptional regulator